MRINSLAIFLCTLCILQAGVKSDAADMEKALQIEKQGSFSAGGSIVPAKEKYDPFAPTPQNQTLHGDHASVFYQVPAGSKKMPLVFLHGAGQSSRTWESTPDGRDGFQNIFLRRGFPVFLVDQPRRGKAGRATVAGEISASPDDQFWFGQFRLGMWPDYYPGSQFAKGEKELDQFFRQITPNTAAYDPEIITGAIAQVFEKSGPGILVSHSQGGGLGWLAAMKSDKIKGIASYEPGSGFIFPEGETPEPIKSSSPLSPLRAGSVPLEKFKALTRIPIVIYYGDNIPSSPSGNPHQDYWRSAIEMARKWVDAVNRHGGDARLVHLPEVGLKGNTHFPFSDRNNIEVADLLSQWLKQKNLEK